MEDIVAKTFTTNEDEIRKNNVEVLTFCLNRPNYVIKDDTMFNQFVIAAQDLVCEKDHKLFGTKKLYVDYITAKVDKIIETINTIL